MATTERANIGCREPAEKHTARFERTVTHEGLPYHVALAIGQAGPPAETAEDDFKDAGAGI